MLGRAAWAASPGCKPRHADAQADRVAGVAGGAAVDGAAAPLTCPGHVVVAGNVRRHLAPTQFADEAGDVIGLVGAERDAARATSQAVEHRPRRLALVRAGRPGDRTSVV